MQTFASNMTSAGLKLLFETDSLSNDVVPMHPVVVLVVRTIVGSVPASAF